MASTVALIVGSGTSLAGVGLGYLGAQHTRRVEARAARRADLRRAYAAYLGVVYAIVGELRAMPDVRPGRISHALSRFLGEAHEYVRTQKHLTQMGGRHRELGDRLAIAHANLQLLEMPDELRRAVDVANGYVEELATNRSEELRARWTEVWAQLQRARATLDE